MNTKPKIFIGSSSEGYSIAELLNDKLSPVAECKLWKEAFEVNKSYLENLVSQIALYDYAILIATADDTVFSRKKRSLAARDNVLFECGLFIGGLGRDRVFYIVENETKIPSDLSGITLPAIPKRKGPLKNQAIEKCILKIKQHIKSKRKTFDLGFLPSSTLAYGYFFNFVERTVERLLDDKANSKTFSLTNKKKFKLKEIQFTVLIPDDLSDNMFNKVRAKRLVSGWQKLKVSPKEVRDYDFSIDVSKAQTGLLHLVDIPFTLNALNTAVELYAKKGHIGKDDREALLEHQAILGFKKTLDYLISKSTIAKKIVKTEIVDI